MCCIQNDVIWKMYRLRIYKGIFCFFLLFNFVTGQSCDSTNLTNSQCSDTQLCNDNTKLCECKPGFKRFNNSHCSEINPHHSQSTTTSKTSSLVESPHQNGSSSVAAIVAPLILITFVICGIYVSRKYKLVNWIRMKMHQRSNNYDEFMIGQDLDDDDDPPLR